VSNEEHILISLTPRHAENIFAGHKLVELRRRTMHITPGTKAWVYVKLPVGAIIGRVTIRAIHNSTPASLWRRFGLVSGLSRSEFFGYFSGVTKGVALELEDVKELRHSVSLTTLRQASGDFQPPQFFVRLISSNPILKAVNVKSFQTG
jgi:predicted transcriptional regulator